MPAELLAVIIDAAARLLPRVTRPGRRVDGNPAGKGRAFGSPGTLIARQGGERVLYRSALTLAAIQTWAAVTSTSARGLARAAVC